MQRRFLPILLVLFALAAAACGGDNEVGSGLDAKDTGKGGSGALGSTTTTAPPETTTTAKSEATTTTTVKKGPTTTAKAAPSLQITIQADTKGSPFQPSVGQVRKGSVVQWNNTDSVPRSVVFDDNSFETGNIAPGASAQYTANTAGTINYHDGTRPYAVASLQVVG
ncbi:MAG TPA: hypothetical protein VM030_04820 [Acidimicrobiales bacterium]|nr:hypothetical protein [Acidimicrobiales bacterium]